MAVELSAAKGSLKATAEELGIIPQILTRWRRERTVVQGIPTVSRAQISQEQHEIARLKKELKQIELERNILKRRSASSPRTTARRTVGNIRIYKGSPSPVSR